MSNGSVLAKMAVLISAETAEFNKSLKDAKTGLSDFSSSIKGIAGTIGVAFGIKEVANFSLEVAKLAGEADGVRAAFEKLPNSVKLMEQLKAATGGTVSELDLMKRAVQASNFDIDLASLPKLLEFATVRAQQTGQSVDYLVDSIVTGIGRKSKLILDNLGISAVQLSEKLHGVGTESATVADVTRAVGEIAAEALQKTGTLADNTSTKVQRLGATWENLKVTLGTLVNNSGLPHFLDKINEDLTRINEQITKGTSLASLKSQIEAFNQIAEVGGFQGKAFFDRFNAIEESAKKLGIRLISLKDPVTGIFKILFDPRTPPQWIDTTNESTQKLIETYEALTEKLKGLNEEFNKVDVTDNKKLVNIGAQIRAINAQIEALDRLRKKQTEQKVGFAPDLEAEGSLNPNLRNEQAANQQKQFAESLNEVANSAEFAGGALIKLDESTAQTTQNLSERWINLSGVVAGAVSNIASAIGSAASGSVDLGRALLGAIGGVLVQLGEILIAAGIGVEAFKKSLESLNGVAAIAAGIALVALGSALSGNIRSLGHSNSGASGRAIGMSTTSNVKNSRNSDIPNTQIDVVVGGTIEVDGQKLRILLQNVDRRNKVSHG